MAAVYTNITSCSHNGTTITNVKSVTVSEELTPLEEQSDGLRTPSIVGDLQKRINVTVEVSDAGIDYDAKLGFSNKGSFVFTTQLESAPATLKTHTITNVVLLTCGLSTDQNNPNGVSLSGRTAAAADTWSVA